MVHLYDQKVQERVVQLGLTTAEEVRKRSVLFRSLCLPGYLIYVLICVYVINGARGFFAGLCDPVHYECDHQLAQDQIIYLFIIVYFIKPGYHCRISC